MIVNLTKRLVGKLTRKSYREAYVAEHVRTGIAAQILALRDQRGWSQGEFAKKFGKPQSVVSRLENPDYGKATISTLLEVAATFDVALLVKYVSFPEFLRRTRDTSVEALQVDSFDGGAFIPTTSQERVVVETSDRTTTVSIGKGPTGPTRFNVEQLQVSIN